MSYETRWWLWFLGGSLVPPLVALGILFFPKVMLAGFLFCCAITCCFMLGAMIADEFS